jgi:hypothetical protein
MAVEGAFCILEVDAKMRVAFRGPCPKHELVTVVCANQLKRSTVTKLTLQLAQNEQKQSKSKEEKLSLSYGWQRDLVEFSMR